MDSIDTQGIRLPRIGLGTFRLKGKEGQAAVESALAMGYRHIDTAEIYETEDAVGAAIAAAGLPRERLHVTTKVWHDHLEPTAIRKALDASLQRLGLDYADLYLVHWPAPGMDLPAILETLVALKEEGLIRALGVSNFPVALMRQAVEEIGAPVACNQVEYHVLLDQSALLAYQQPRGIPLVAYSPLAHGNLGDYGPLNDCARRHAATPHQIALAWLLDQDLVAAIPKSARAEAQRANFEAQEISLTDEDRSAIASLPKDKRMIDPEFAPDWD